ncbi:MAG: hypothetical protein ACHBN1_33800 [Heteroscytonema crispum UTEX LB 1556]
MFFRSLRLLAQQVLDAWDAWQIVESGDDATNVYVVAPTLGLVHLILDWVSTMLLGD